MTRRIGARRDGFEPGRIGACEKRRRMARMETVSRTATWRERSAQITGPRERWACGPGALGATA